MYDKLITYLIIFFFLEEFEQIIEDIKRGNFVVCIVSLLFQIIEQIIVWYPFFYFFYFIRCFYNYFFTDAGLKDEITQLAHKVCQNFSSKFPMSTHT